MKETGLIFLAILVVLAISAAGFIFLKNAGLLNNQTVNNPCAGVEEPESGVMCKDAVARALELHPGSVNSVQLTTTEVEGGPGEAPQDVELWLVDINVENPIETESEMMQRIIVAVEPTPVLGIDSFVYEFFSFAL